MVQDAGKRLPLLVEDVARNIRELRFAKPLVELLSADIELVVAKGDVVQPHRVEHSDHLLAGQAFSLDPRRADSRRTVEIAGEEAEGVRVFSRQA